MARRHQRRLRAAATLLIGSLLINTGSCVPKDFFFNVAAATQQTLATAITSLVANTVTSSVVGAVPTPTPSPSPMP